MKSNKMLLLVTTLTLGTALLSSTASAKSMNVVLRLKERVSMEELAQSVMDPSSSHYNQFYSPEEIRDLAGPSEIEYQSLLKALESKGMKVVSESKTHLFITVNTEHTNVENTFKAKLKTNGTHFTGLTAKATIPDELSLVESITGLDQTQHVHSLMHSLKGAPKPNFATQADIKAAYGFNPIYASGVRGTGQHIAIATYDGFYLADINGFFKQSKISPAPKVDQVTFNGTPAVNNDSAVETSLDGEFAGMMAPGAAIHIFASAENSDAGESAMFTAILDDNRAKVVNYSWGSCETGADPTHVSDMTKIYSRAVAQGVNIFVASGDSGADGCGDGTKVTSLQSSNPYAVAVGGTTFSYSNKSLSESAWSGSGGGVSTLFALPSYQSNFQSPYIKRSVPDVAFNADPNSGEQVWTSCVADPNTGSCTHGKQSWMTIGGTSMAAPQWAGFLALVNEARVKAKKQPIGFINPILYSLSSSDRAKTLHDITSGSNGYSAGRGWDAVTGNGSLQANALLTYLVNQK